jgi:protein-tyrosine phosphatase
MIDIHCHILPGLDDGSPDLEESVAMLRLAAQTGTTDIVATPHSDLQYAFDPAVVEGKIAELTEAAAGLVRIHYGCDFHLHYENVHDALASPSKYAVNHKTYVLVELSELLIVKTAEGILERMRAAGMIPIITHPERNSILQQRIDQLGSWVGSGCCIQVTAQSLLGGFGRKAKAFSEELMQRGLVQFVASDGHDREHRPPRLDLACRLVRDRYGEATAERLFTTNPAAVLAGEDLPREATELPPPRRRWWRLSG